MTSWKKAVLISLGAILLISFILGSYLYNGIIERPIVSELPGAITKVATVNESSPYYVGVEIKPDVIEMDVNETETVNINILNAENVHELLLYLAYNDRYIEIVSISSDYGLNFSKSWAYDHYALPLIKIEGKLDGVNNTTLAKITFRSTSDGKTALSFFNGELYDAEGRKLNHILHSAEIIIGNPELSEESKSFDPINFAMVTFGYVTLPLAIIYGLVFAIVFAIGKVILRIKRNNFV